jgi:hypothetical protein
VQWPPFGGLREECSVRVLAEEQEVGSRLEQLGLSLDGLVRVVSAAAGGFNSTTAFHPTPSAGSYLYYEGTAAFRRLVIPDGWEMDELDGQPRTFSRTLGLTVVVQSGDEMTGIDGEREPQTRHPKGPATARKVAVNGQLDLFKIARPEAPEDLGLQTWVLLMAVVEGQMRGELSRPERMSPGSRPCGWSERILLPSQPMGGGAEFDLAEPVNDAPDTDFDVSWQQR